MFLIIRTRRQRVCASSTRSKFSPSFLLNFPDRKYGNTKRCRQFLHFARYIIIVNTSDTPIIEPTMIITGRMLS